MIEADARSLLERHFKTPIFELEYIRFPVWYPNSAGPYGGQGTGQGRYFYWEGWVDKNHRAILVYEDTLIRYHSEDTLIRYHSPFILVSNFDTKIVNPNLDDSLNKCDGWGAFGHRVTYQTVCVEFYEDDKVVQTKNLCPMCMNSFLQKEANITKWKVTK